MARRDGSWQFTLELDGGRVVRANTDDLTLDELETAEQASGVPWSLMNPLRSVKVATALLAVLLIRNGEPEDKALATAGKLTAAQALDAFEFLPPTGQPLPEPTEPQDPPS